MSKAAVIFSFGVLLLACRATVFGAASSEDRVVVYDMKEDPTIKQFIANDSIKGFYGLEIDEDRGEAAVLYRVDDILYRADIDVAVKGSQLILKNRKHRKILVREQSTSPSGAVQEIIYPVECPPAKAGWLRGPSFGKHVIARNDEMGERLLVGSAHLEFKIAMERCGGAAAECGDAGCPELGAIESSSSTKTGVRLSTGPVPLSQALLDGKLSDQTMLTTYKSEINAVLPLKLSDLGVMTTSYHTTGLPYPGFSDPFIEQRGFKIGVLAKSYATEAKPDAIVVEVEPLLAEYQDPSTTKCGAWETAPNKTLFDWRGHPAMYIQTPATGNAPVYSGIFVCGRSISVAVHTESYRSKDELIPFVDVLPMEQMEHVVGGKK